MGLAEAADVQGLASLWFERLPAHCANVDVARLRQVLWSLRRDAAARYLLQRQAAVQICRWLEAAAIPFAVIKGMAVREMLYEDPSLRPVADLDILVAAPSRDLAVTTLASCGLRLCADRATVSHEVVLRGPHLDLDLHWAPFRPGRSRCDLVLPLLATARSLGPFRVLDDNANLLLMLVHPAFAKHVNGRAAKLIRVVDLDLMLRAKRVDWDWILSLIDAAGLRAAAWAVLHWQRLLMHTPVDPAVLRHLEPGPSQRRYLAWWIEHHWPARLEPVPGLVQTAFTLALHDRVRDVIRVLFRLAQVRLVAARTLTDLERLV